MKLGAVAIDYDGTIATNDAFDPSVRDAIAQLRLRDVAVILVTGRRLPDLQRVAGNLECFSAVWPKTARCSTFLKAAARPSSVIVHTRRFWTG